MCERRVEKRWRDVLCEGIAWNDPRANVRNGASDPFAVDVWIRNTKESSFEACVHRLARVEAHGSNVCPHHPSFGAWVA